MVAGGGPSGADPPSVLTGVDELAALAPAQIHGDFRLFARFEHAVLDAQHGRLTDMKQLNTPRLALAMRHVGVYLAGTCGISG